MAESRDTVFDRGQAVSLGIQLGWAIGLFEGEGCISIKRRLRDPRARVELELHTTDRDIAERFKTLAGCGRVSFIPRRNPKHKPIWSWCIGDHQHVKRLLVEWLPYLGRRRRAKALDALVIIEQFEHDSQRVCPSCGKPFIAKNLKAKFCSQLCGVRYRRKAANPQMELI